jgi:hypothetical protein
LVHIRALGHFRQGQPKAMAAERFNQQPLPH